MTEKEYQVKMENLKKVEKISSKLFNQTGRIAYYGAVQGARDLQKMYTNQRNNNVSELE